MATALFTTAGANFINGKIVGGVAVLEDLKVQVGTGRQTAAASVTELATPYMFNSAAHVIALNQVAAQDLSGTTQRGARFEFRDGTPNAAYEATEIGVYDSTLATLIAYIVADAGETLLVKPTTGSITWSWIMRLGAVTAQDFTLTITQGTPSDATATRKGIVELATNAESKAGTDTLRAVTPRGLAERTPDASATAKGLIEIASQSEADAGTDTTRAMTPALVKRIADNASPTIRDASATQKGVIEIATNAEVDAGTDTARAVTPAGVARRTPNASASARGLIEIASQSEADAGTDTARAMTPALVKRRIDASIPGAASATARGTVELATNAETATGTDAARATTPAGIASLGYRKITKLTQAEYDALDSAVQSDGTLYAISG